MVSHAYLPIPLVTFLYPLFSGVNLALTPNVPNDLLFIYQLVTITFRTDHQAQSLTTYRLR